MDQTNHRWSVNENHGDALLAEYRYGDDFYEINVQTGDIEIEIYKSKNCSSRNDTGGNLYDCTTAAEGRGTQNTDGRCDGTKHQRRDG